MKNGTINKNFGVDVNAVTGATGFKAWLSPFELETYNAYVESHEYEAYRRKTTVCILILKSGFEVVGVAGCEDPLKFDDNLGHQYALKDALRKLGEFAAFHRAEVKRLASTTELRVSKELSPFEIEEIRRLLKEAQEKPSIWTSDVTCGSTVLRTTPGVVSTTSKAYEAQVKTNETYNNI